MKNDSARARWLTPPQIARDLGIEPAKVIGWVKRGELRACNLADRIGGQRPRFRISPAELERFLAARQAGPPAPKQRRRRQELIAREEWF